MRLSLVEVATQEAALQQLVTLARKGSVHPLVRDTALQIIRGCDARDDGCELTAIFDAVKSGDKRIPALRQGLKYVADPNWADFFTAPARLLAQCAKGGGLCAEDCDGHAMLVAALAASVGFKSGLRIWGPKNGSEYVHVYAVTALPKRPPHNMVVGLDTTVKQSYPGWEPPPGRTKTAVL